MQKIVPVHVIGGKVTAVFIPDLDKEHTCPWCGVDFYIGRNKFGLNMAVEWTRGRGWFVHQRDCHEFQMDKLRCAEAHFVVESSRTDFVLKPEPDENANTESFKHIKGQKL